MNKMRLSALVIALAMWLPASTAGQVEIEPVTAGNVTVSLPKGWKTTRDAVHGVFAARRDTGHLDAPAMMVVVQPSGVTATEDQLLDAMVKQAATDIKVIERTRLQPQGRQLIAEGDVGEVRVRIAVIVIASNGGAITGLLGAKPSEFDSLGGTGLVSRVLASIKVSAPPAGEGRR